MSDAIHSMVSVLPSEIVATSQPQPLARTIDEQCANVIGNPAIASPELKLSSQLFQEGQLRLHFAGLGDLLPWGVLVVDEKLKIIYANQRAILALLKRVGLICRKRVLYTERASLNRALRDLVELVPSKDSNRNQGASVIGIPDKHGRLRYALRVVSVGGTLIGNVAVITIGDLSSGSKVRRAEVARLFCLSERESEFAELFASGLRIPEIALQMHVAVNTVRVHLRSVFLKTDCSSQVALARKFAALP